MSNYHSYHCLDCNVSEKPSNLNRGHVAMCAVLRYKKEAVALMPLGAEDGVWDFSLQLSYGHYLPFEFLAKHLDHHMVVLSEYRDHYYEEDGTRHEKEVPY